MKEYKKSQTREKGICGVWLPIQIPDTEVQVCGKGRPEQIWDLKFRRKRIDLEKRQNHP